LSTTNDLNGPDDEDNYVINWDAWADTLKLNDRTGQFWLNLDFWVDASGKIAEGKELDDGLLTALESTYVEFVVFILEGLRSLKCCVSPEKTLYFCYNQGILHGLIFLEGEHIYNIFLDVIRVLEPHAFWAVVEHEFIEAVKEVSVLTDQSRAKGRPVRAVVVRQTGYDGIVDLFGSPGPGGDNPLIEVLSSDEGGEDRGADYDHDGDGIAETEVECQQSSKGENIHKT
jgi:hypothetical protein